MSEQQLIYQIQAGGIASQRCTNQLFSQYQGMVYQALKYYPISLESLQDAYTDAFTGMIIQIQKGSYRAESKLSTYLYKAFHNRCMDRIRKQSRPRPDLISEYPVLEDPSSNNLYRLIEQEQMNYILSYGKKAGGKPWSVLYDVIINGYSLEETAHRNGLKNAQTASSLKYRCIVKLRKRFAKSEMKG